MAENDKPVATLTVTNATSGRTVYDLAIDHDAIARTIGAIAIRVFGAFFYYLGAPFDGAGFPDPRIGMGEDGRPYRTIKREDERAY